MRKKKDYRMQANELNVSNSLECPRMYSHFTQCRTLDLNLSGQFNIVELHVRRFILAGIFFFSFYFRFCFVLFRWRPVLHWVRTMPRKFDIALYFCVLLFIIFFFFFVSSHLKMERRTVR